MGKSKFSMSVFVALVIGLVIGFSLGAVVYKDEAPNLSANLEDEATLEVDEEANIITAGTDGVVPVGTEGQVTFEVSDQTAGAQVIVDTASLDRTGWLAVREFGAGKIGNVLGAKRLPAGIHELVEIELLRPTVSEQGYVVVAFYDDGDLAFDQKKDSPVKNGDMVLLQAFATK